MPRFQANNMRRKKVPVTREQILAVKKQHPNAKRQQLAELLGCSEQTIQRRLEDNNVRGGKQAASTKVVLTGCMVAEWAEEAGFHLYDQRIWHKDPCWANSRWHSNSYRAVDEFEHIYVFWRPGITDYDRNRLTADEWASWGFPRRLEHPLGPPQRPPRSRIPRRTGRPSDPPVLPTGRRGARPLRRHRHHHRRRQETRPPMAGHR